jgi:hypothetical protein
MNRIIKQISIVLTILHFSIITANAHDAWLAAKWNVKNTHVLISPVVAEAFPSGEPIKDMKRFIEPSAYFPDGHKLILSGDPKDSTVLGYVPSAASFIVATGVKQREITYDQKVALEYITEEIGLTKDEAAAFITPGVKEFSETYSRHLKTLVVTGNGSPKDTTLGLPLEFVVISWKESGPQQASITFRLLADGKPIAGVSIRVLSSGETTMVTTDSVGTGGATVDRDKPALLAYIQLKKLSESRLQSVWTNLAIYRLEK